MKTIMCVYCGGSGVVARLNNAPCIPCNGTGELNEAQQLKDQAIRLTNERIGRLQKLVNMSRHQVEQFDALTKQHPYIVDVVKVWEKLAKRELAGLEVASTEYRRARRTMIEQVWPMVEKGAAEVKKASRAASAGQ